MASSQRDEKSIFGVARKIDSAEARSVYLKEACGGDPALLDRLTALLRAHDEDHGFLESPPPGLSPRLDPPPVAEQPGQTIGHYKLLAEIGEGGMGAVYMAEQQEPVRRNVAFKIIKPGMDTRAVIARFEAERQALALMDHPNIAKVFDAGATDSGRPYFVMELVYGIPLTDYCDQNELTTRERLELFLQVCQAVQHAHQKGIIHRDLKPSHVMVTLYDGVPVPKIIDFGIAKAVKGRLTEKTLYTSYGQMVGTPLYMSPEQAELSGLDVDTRSDIYSLGVVLYELLTGSTPFDQERVRESGYDEIRRMIREEDPPRPSSRISTLGAGGKRVQGSGFRIQASEPGRVGPAGKRGQDSGFGVQGSGPCAGETNDGRALEVPNPQSLIPNPSSPSPLAPFPAATIAARRKTDPARLTQLLRRDLDWIVMKALAKDRTRRYQTASDFARDIERYLADEPIEARPPTLFDRAAKWARRHRTLVASAACIAATVLVATTLLALGYGELAGRRLRVQQGINDALAEVARLRGQAQSAALGDQTALAQAREQMQRAVGLAESGPAAPEVLAQVQGLLGELDQEQRDQQLLAALDKAWLARANLTRDASGFDVKASIPILRDALEAYGLAVGKGPPEEAAAFVRKRPPAVRQELLGALEELRALSLIIGLDVRTGPGGTYIHRVVPDTPAARDGSLKPGDRIIGIGQGRDGEIVDTRAVRLAEVLMVLRDQRATIVRLKVVPEGRTEPRICEIQRPADATVAWLKAVVDAADTDSWRRRVRDAHDIVELAKQRTALEKLVEGADVERQPVRALTRLAEWLADLDAADRAIALLRKVRARHPGDLAANMSLARTLLESKPRQLEEAVRYDTAAVALRPDSAALRFNLGIDLKEQGKLEQGIAEFREAIRLKPDLPAPHNNLGAALADQGKLEEAIAEWRETIRLNPRHVGAHTNLGVALSYQGKYEEAVAEGREVIRLKPDVAASHNQMAWLLATAADPKWRQPAQAVELAKKAVALAAKEAGFWNTLGVAQYRAGDHKAAIESLAKSMELGSGGSATDRFVLAMAHWQLGQKDEARTWYDKAVAWMDKNAPKSEEFLRFRAEAAQLLGIPEKPKAESGKPIPEP